MVLRFLSLFTGYVEVPEHSCQKLQEKTVHHCIHETGISLPLGTL